MTQDPNAEMVTVHKKHLARLESEVERLRAESKRTTTKAALLEERARTEALHEARRRVLDESLRGRATPVDPSRAAGLLERLTAGIDAVVDDTGRAFVPDKGLEEIKEQARVILDAIGSAPGVISPPIQPGEPPRRGERRPAGGPGNSWDAPERKHGFAKGREMLISAVKELERDGVL